MRETVLGICIPESWFSASCIASAVAAVAVQLSVGSLHPLIKENLNALSSVDIVNSKVASHCPAPSTALAC